MPIHEFRCLNCNYTFELLIMSNDELESVRCPKCQSPEVTKLMSAGNISVNEGPSKTTPQSHSGVEHHKCESGTCATVNLPGYER
ncbi:MAG: zinc ribbon domain-containing protein [Nitrospiraceae bacterium]|nr:zinc ribbon domain-containing protein [Nitrospiraceae bacterium]